MLEFIQSQDDELTRLEIEQRVKEKLERRIEIDADTIQVITAFRGDAITVHASFRFRGDERLYELDVDLDRVKVEVVLVD